MAGRRIPAHYGAGLMMGWLRQTRQSAIARFEALGFPTDRDPNWQYTNVKPIADTPFTQVTRYERNGLTAEQLTGVAFGARIACQLVFVDGHYAPELSAVPALPVGTLVGSLAAILETSPNRVEPHLARYADIQRQGFTALNTAFFADGAFVQLPKGTVLNLPIHLMFVSTARRQNTVSHPRVLILAERETKAAIIESYVGLAGHPYFTNAVTELLVGENAQIAHYKLQRESESAFHIATLQIRQDRASTFTSHSISLGGALVRNDLNVVLAEEEAECTLNGLYMVAGRQHVDHHTIIDHVKPHSSSRELYKGVLDGESRAVFNGSIIVRPDAQKTDAMQTNKNLLLADGAIVHTKPELKIFANDVKCKHGATIGQISPDALFYLRSRGIPREAARRLLTYAFVSEMIARIGVEPLREGFTGWLSAREQLLR